MGSKNPFGFGIVSVVRQLQGQRWEPPYLANLVTTFTLVVVIGILALLYPTIGLCMQLTGTFLRLVRDTFREMKPKPAVEKVGHGVAIGVYVICVVAFGAVTVPFYLTAYMLEWLGMNLEVA